MGFFSQWFGSDRPADDGASRPGEVSTLLLDLDESAAQTILSEIDIDQAIAAHEDWKLRLQNYLYLHLDEPPPEDLRPENIGRADCCALGKWLHGPGQQRLGGHPSFAILMTRHQYFHEQAAAVIEAAHAGQPDVARRILEGSYRHSSNQILLLLKGLKRGLHARS